MIKNGMHMATETLPAFSKARVVVLGDLMLDRYWLGDTSRISPEAPVPVVLIDQHDERAGGAANVALNMASLTAQVSLLGLVGKDQEGQLLQSLCEEKNVRCFFHATAHHTITKLRVMGRNQQLLRMDFEKTAVSEEDVGALQALLAEQLSHADVVVLSDYAKGALQQVEDFISLAKQKNIPVLIDPKAKDFSRYRGATLVTPNYKEFCAAVGPCDGLNEIAEKAQHLLKETGVQALLVTLGKEGMLLVEASRDAWHFPTQAKDVFDVTGAGDTVIATIAASLGAGVDLKQAVHYANVAAGIVVGKSGTSTVSVPELRRALQKDNESQLGILTQADCLQAVHDAKARGEKIVMTNGCFDILHAGHIHYLEEARALGDRLIVAVNSDESVRQLKGDTRPYNALQQRMEVLAALRCVDWVVAFTQATPAPLIETILPDLLVKGGDYKPEEIAGNEAVYANGGEVLSLRFCSGFSTTQLVKKIQKEGETV